MKLQPNYKIEPNPSHIFFSSLEEKKSKTQISYALPLTWNPSILVSLSSFTSLVFHSFRYTFIFITSISIFPIFLAWTQEHPSVPSTMIGFLGEIISTPTKIRQQSHDFLWLGHFSEIRNGNISNGHEKWGEKNQRCPDFVGLKRANVCINRDYREYRWGIH